MDLRVHLKENLNYTEGEPHSEQNGQSIIDLYPVYSEDGLSVTDAEILEGSAETYQECLLNTLYQRGLDPVEPDSGVRWSEVLLEEISAITFMNDITIAVEEVSLAATVTFDTAVAENGESYLTYRIEVQD